MLALDQIESPPVRARVANSTGRLKVALISDYLEEGWPSMDLISDMLLDHLQTKRWEGIDVAQIRPTFRQLPFSRSQLARNVDRLINRQYFYPRYLNKLNSTFDVFHIVDHSYAHLVNFLPSEHAVVTCHDLDAFRCLIEPKNEPRPKWFRAMTERTLKGLQRAKQVIFVTEAVRRRAVASGIVESSRSCVVPMGVHPACSPSSNVAADQAASRLLGTDPGFVILHVGSTVPRKRIDILLEVFASVHSSIPKATLVRVGGPFTRPQQQLANDLDVTDRIVHLPFLDRSVLAAVYRRADLVLQTSDNEGFGLPLVEAMACGCPVIASDIEVLREVGGPVTDFCRVGDVDHWSETVLKRIGQLRSHNETERAARLAHAARFTWSRTTDQMIEIYRTITAN